MIWCVVSSRGGRYETVFQEKRYEGLLSFLVDGWCKTMLESWERQLRLESGNVRVCVGGLFSCTGFRIFFFCPVLWGFLSFVQYWIM